jgi:hypothetical protein
VVVEDFPHDSLSDSATPTVGVGQVLLVVLVQRIDDVVEHCAELLAVLRAIEGDPPNRS